MTAVDVGSLDDFPPSGVRVVEVGGAQVGIVRWDGAVYALSNVCTHQKGPVCEGVLSPLLVGAGPGVMGIDASVPVLACPWHGWEFDVRTGRAVWDPKYRIRTYPVRVDRGRVLVETGRRSAEQPGV